MNQKPAERGSARLGEVLGCIARQPKSEDLWRLRVALLAYADDGPAEHRSLIDQALDLTREFDQYLSELKSKLQARHYNELASRLDMGAVGALAIQNLLTEGRESLKSYLLGGLSEGMIILASRQYIKAWDREMRSAHHRAVWFLYGALWRISRQAQPGLAADKRQALIDDLMSPAMDEEAPPQVRATLLTRLFQIGLLVLLAPLWAGGSSPST